MLNNNAGNSIREHIDLFTFRGRWRSRGNIAWYFFPARNEGNASHDLGVVAL
jgi:hypothetical protein